MKIRTIVIGASLAAIVGVFLLGSQTSLRANDQPPLRESHKQQIAGRCDTVKASLRQLHRSDASLRVNRGQLYESIGTQLMARLNSRLALNQLDAGQMVAIAAGYNRSLNDFRTTYKRYEEAISAALRIKCDQQPEEFYYQLIAAREARGEVYQRIGALNSAVSEFYDVFGRLALSYGVQVKGQSDE